MAEYQVLARKYRPQRFSDVLGQQAIISTLKNSIRMGRTAHAYLFCGSRGTGKTSVARLFAKALNCASLEAGEEPCNNCPSCKDIARGHALDVLEIDGASHRGIEDIRQINETIGFAPSAGHYKIYLIDEVHMLTKEAFNALLKTLEEPPAHAKFFFATTEVHKIPATILSRCQRFNLGRISFEAIQQKLASIATDLSLSVEPEALASIAELSEGSLRDAEGLFDQVIAFQEGVITAETVRELLGLPSRDTFFALDEAGKEKNLSAAFTITGDLFATGKNISYFLEELLTHFRTLFLLKNGMGKEGSNLQRYQRSASFYRPEQVLQILELIFDAQQTIKSAPSEKIALEMLLLKILRTHQHISLESLVQRLAQLETHVSSSPPQEIAPVKKEIPSSEKPALKVVSSVETTGQQCRFDTLVRFAAKELNGSFKKES